MYNSSRYGSSFYNVSANGVVTELPVRYDPGYDGPGFSGYSDGLFFANGFFYDIQGKEKLNLTKYNLTSTPYFENGECTLVFKNEAGTEYTAVIDANGSFASEPQIK